MNAMTACRSMYRSKLSSGRLGTLTSLKSLSSSANTPAPEIVSSPRLMLTEKFRNLLSWYEEVTGIKDVRLSQSKVLTAEDRFIAAQDARRDVSKQLAAVRERLKDIYAELDQTSRGEDRYVVLITQEHKVLKDERRLADLFNRCEQEERENFASLSSAVKESHEKERMQAERTKYWSIIGSIIGTMIGVLGSSINNEFKMRELRKLVRESAQATLASRLESGLPTELTTVTNDVKEATERLILERKNLAEAVREYDKIIGCQAKEIQNLVNSRIQFSEEGSGLNIDKLLQVQQRENRLLAFVCVSSVISLYFVSKFFG